MQTQQTNQMNDPVIDEIREVRHRISERFGHDPDRLVAYYVQLQQQYRDRLIVRPAAVVSAQSASELGTVAHP